MYNPAHFLERRSEVLQAAINKHPLAALVTFGPEGLESSHLPLLFDPQTGEHGTLRGHLARANPQWKNYSPDVEALVLFRGPQHYVSPSWYPSKEEHGKVVPTWNYIVIEARGRLVIREDRDWLLRLVTQLTERQEQASDNPWKVSDAPSDFIDSRLQAIVGVEIPISYIEGKWKLSQNRPEADRRAVESTLRNLGFEEMVDS